MASDLETKLSESLDAREQQGLLRRLRSATDGIDFSSNDYLNLARDADLQAAIEQKVAGSSTCGSTGSRLISGNSTAVESLEAQIADFHRAPAALLFSSGYAANIALFSCLLGSGDTLITDRLVHASILDGVQLGKARHLRFQHNDLDSLESRLRQAEGNVVIGVESVYSMDGDSAPLAQMAELAEQFNAALIVDEAHSVGMDGPAGAGAVVAAGLEQRVFARVVTFGKALGLHGAAVIGSERLRQYLINFARPFIYSTAPPPHFVESIRAVYEQLPKLDARRDRLRDRIDYFRKQVSGSSHEWLDSKTAIQSVVIPGNHEVRQVATQLQASGFNLVPIVAPTVPTGTERIRITLHAHNSDAEIDRLFDSLETISRVSPE